MMTNDFMMIRTICMLCFGLLCCLDLLAQNQQKIDSLSAVYQRARVRAQPQDTLHLLALSSIADEYRRTRPDTSLVLATQALTESQQIGWLRGQAMNMHTIGGIHLNKNNFPLALDFHQKSLQILEKLGDQKGIVASLNNIGLALQFQGKYGQALDYHQRSLRLKQQLNDQSGAAISLNNIALIYQYQGQYAESLNYFRQSFDIRTKLGDKAAMAASLNNIGGILQYQGDYAAAIQAHQQSIQLKEELKDKAGMALSLNNIGVICKNQGNYPLALEYHQKSLSLREETRDKAGIATSLTNMAILYQEMNNDFLALQYLEKSLQIREELKDKKGMISVLNNLGILYVRQSNYTQALETYQKSLRIQEEVGGDKRMMIYSMHGLARLYHRQQRYDESIELAEKALTLAQQTKAPQEISEVSNTLFENYKAKQDWQKALQYHELYKQFNDSLFDLDKAKAIANLENKAQIERQQKEIVLLAKDNELQRIENERRKNAQSLLEKQAEAQRLRALAMREQDRRKQDSLQNLAQTNQLEAEKLKIREAQLSAESKSKQLEILQEKEAKEFQQQINYFTWAGILALMLFTWLVLRSRQEIKNAKQLIEEQKREIEFQNEELRIQSEQLGQANDTKDKLFAILGHDLRAPIASLEGILRLMNMGMVSQEEFQAFTPKFHQNVKNMQSTLENLLQWSVSQMQGIQAKPDVISLDALVEEKIQLFAEVARAKQISLVSDLAGEWRAVADPNHVRLVLRNLINNAIKFTPEGGHIHLLALREADLIWVQVKDSGVGMSAEQSARLFAKNQHFTTYGTNGEKGTGLGLQLCQEILHKNGGQLTVSSAPGEGSTFSFSLPAA